MCVVEVLLEPETKFKIRKIECDNINKSVKRVIVDVLPNTVVLESFVSLFSSVPKISVTGFPTNWLAKQDNNGRTYYVNTETSKPQWNYPMISEGWIEQKDTKTGEIFYINLLTRETQWAFPSRMNQL